MTTSPADGPDEPAEPVMLAQTMLAQPMAMAMAMAGPISH